MADEKTTNVSQGDRLLGAHLDVKEEMSRIFRIATDPNERASIQLVLADIHRGLHRANTIISEVADELNEEVDMLAATNSKTPTG